MRTLILLLLTIFIVGTVNSQNIGFQLKSFPGLWSNETAGLFGGGGGAELYYDYPLAKNSWRGGVEFRSVDWGNQTTLNLGYNNTFLEKGQWSVHGISSLGLGLALFKPRPLLVFSLEYLGEVQWRTQKRIGVNLGLGLRYSHSPAYTKYGVINQLFEVPITLGLIYSLKKKVELPD